MTKYNVLLFIFCRNNQRGTFWFNCFALISFKITDKPLKSKCVFLSKNQRIGCWNLPPLNSTTFFDGMVCSNGSYSIVHTTAPIVSWECKIFFPSHNNWKQRVVYIHTTSKGAFKRCVYYIFFRSIGKQNRVLVNSLESKCPQNCFDNILYF